MLAKNHIKIAFSSFIFFEICKAGGSLNLPESVVNIISSSVYGGVTDLVIAALLVALGSYLPDIDTVESKLGRQVKPVAMLIQATAGHRGVMHSLLPIVIMFILFKWLFTNAATADFVSLYIGIGYFAHLIADLFFGNKGVPLFYPIIKTKLSLFSFFRVGGTIENITATVSLLAVAGYFLISTNRFF